MQLQNPNAIYAGQVLNLPGAPQAPMYHAKVREWDLTDPQEGAVLRSLPTLTDDGFCSDPMGCQSSEAGSGVSNAQRVQQYDTMMVNTLPDLFVACVAEDNSDACGKYPDIVQQELGDACLLGKLIDGYECPWTMAASVKAPPFSASEKAIQTKHVIKDIVEWAISNGVKLK